MTALTGWLGFVLRLIAMVGALWLISAAADHVWPESKWYLVALFLAGWLFLLARQFAGGVSQCHEATEAFIHRRILSADLPPDFRSLSHEKTLQQVLDEFGPPSRTFELVTPATSLGKGVKFLAYEYELPYEAAVVVMPEPPGAPNCKIRAVYFRPRPDDDEIFSPVRA